MHPKSHRGLWYWFTSHRYGSKDPPFAPKCHGYGTLMFGMSEFCFWKAAGDLDPASSVSYDLEPASSDSHDPDRAFPTRMIRIARRPSRIIWIARVTRRCCYAAEHMHELLLSNGGQVAESAAAATTTHLVIDENNVDLLPPDLEVGQP